MNDRQSNEHVQAGILLLDYLEVRCSHSHMKS